MLALGACTTCSFLCSHLRPWASLQPVSRSRRSRWPNHPAHQNVAEDVREYTTEARSPSGYDRQTHLKTWASLTKYQMNGDWRYYFSDYFPSDWHCSRGELTRLDLGVLDDIVNRIPPKIEETKPKNKPASLMLTFPLDTEAEGPLIVEPNPDWKLFHHMDSSIEFLWTATGQPGRGINVTSVEIQQGSTTSSKTTGAHIAFDTPYIGLPDDTYDFLFLATKPQRVDMGRGIRPVDIVDCNSISRFPNIVLQYVTPGDKVRRRNRKAARPYGLRCCALNPSG